MKKTISAALLSLAIASAAFAHGGETTARWSGIAGVITAGAIDNPVGNVHSGTFAWTARGGRARVNLTSGVTSFDVDGLVINGTQFSGTPGPVTAVTGTLVCNPGENHQQNLDTAPVPLDSRGDAEFHGNIGPIPAQCANPLFLIRIAVPTGAAGFWIATGVERSVFAPGAHGHDDDDD
jgi:hypothetical protein